MRITVSKKQLVAAVKTIMPAAAKRATLPILAGVHLDASASGLWLEATDLEVSVRRQVNGAQVIDAGSLVVPAKAFAKAATTMSGDELSLAAESDGRPKLTIRSGSRTVTLEGFPAEDWPRIAALDDTTLVARMPAGVLADAFGRVAICASTDEARPVLTSVAMFLDGSVSTMEVVATDSYRLGAVTIRPDALVASVPSPLLIPARAAGILAKQLRRRRAPVEIRVGAASDEIIAPIRFSFGDAVWSVRPVEGEFPNWRQLLPEFGTGASCEFDSTELASALKAMAAVRQNGSPVRLSLGERSSLVLAERDLGEVTEELVGARFNPDGIGALDVAFNPELLADALRFCGGERVRVWLRDGLKPALFGEPEARYLLMPVRIS